MRSFVTAALLSVAVIGGPAYAQTAQPADRAAPAATTNATAGSSKMMLKGNWRASKLMGLDVYNEANESLGSINDLLMDKSGNIKGVVIGVGGFLGVGEHLVALPFDKVKFVTEPVAYTGTAGAGSTTAPRPGSTTTTGAANTATTAATPAKPNPWYPDHAVISATKDQLKAMPEFKYAI